MLTAGIYFHAVFPMSVAVAGALGYVALLAERRWLLAGLAGAVTALAYPTAGLIALAGLVSVGVLVRDGVLVPLRALGAVAAACGPPLLAVLALFGFMQVTLGHWDAYMLVQAKYPGQGHNPLANFMYLVTEPAPVNGAGRRSLSMAALLHPAVHAAVWLNLTLTVLAAAGAAIAARRRSLTAVDAGLAVYIVAMFLAPLLVGTHVSAYRTHTLLLPGLFLLRHLPAWVLWPAAAVMLPLAYRMGVLFYPSLLF